jgi:hypothetical protein
MGRKGERMSRPMQTRVLTESYSGYLERYNPFSTNRDTITIGLPGDIVEVHSTWRDLKTESTWLCVQVQGEQGWLLENETSPRPEK